MKYFSRIDLYDMFCDKMIDKVIVNLQKLKEKYSTDYPEYVIMFETAISDDRGDQVVEIWGIPKKTKENTI